MFIDFDKKWKSVYVKILSRQTGKTTAIRRIAVRKTVVSRHHGCPIKGIMGDQLRLSLKSFEGAVRLSQHYRIDLKKGSLIGPHYAERNQFLEQLMYFF